VAISDEMSLVQVQQYKNVAVIQLNNGITNPIDMDLLEELSATLSKIKVDPNVLGAVLRSTNDKFFSIGFNLPQLIEFSFDDFETFYRLFNRVSLQLFTFPKPTVAAINGHAVAGGCILTLCCDYRVIAEGKKLMGLNEVDLGVPVPYPGDMILRQIVGEGNARHIMLTGKFFAPEESLRMGLVDEVLPLDQVVARSIELAKELGSFPTEAFRTIKQNHVELVQEHVLARLEEKENIFMTSWFSDDTRVRLEEAKKKF